MENERGAYWLCCTSRARRTLDDVMVVDTRGAQSSSVEDHQLGCCCNWLTRVAGAVVCARARKA